MTANHYVNHNDEEFLDSAFSLGINFQYSPEVKKWIINRDVELDLTGQLPVFNRLNKKNLPMITIDCENILKNRLTTSALDGNLL